MTERKILIGLITSTEYLKAIHNIWNAQFIESTTAKRIAHWIWEYYDKYEHAPGKDMEAIFFDKLKSGKLPADLAEEIEQEILPSLSDESVEEPVNVPYLVDLTKKYFDERHLDIHTENIKALKAKGEIEQAKKLAADFVPLSTSKIILSDFILSVPQIRDHKTEKPLLLMKPWLRAGQLTILYGNFGSGKSLLSIAVAYMLGLVDSDNDDCEVGEWMIKNPTGCLYIDGELGEKEMEERVAQFEWLGPQSNKYKIRILSIPEYQLATEDTFDMADRKNQLEVVKWLKEHPTYKFIILDSVSTVFGLQDENSNSEWNSKVSPLLRDLRALDVGCLLLHHSGKDGKKGLRGASAMGAMAQNIFRLTNHPKKNIDEGEAWFILSKDKYRAPGKSFPTFALRFTQENDGKETHWEVTDIH